MLVLFLLSKNVILFFQSLRFVKALKRVLCLYLLFFCLNKSRPIITLTEIYLEGVLILWELGEVFLCYFLFYLFLLRGINEGNAGTFEACSRETTTIDAIRGEHGFVDGYQLRTTALIVMDAALARSLDKTAKPLQVTGLPGITRYSSLSQSSISRWFFLPNAIQA